MADIDSDSESGNSDSGAFHPSSPVAQAGDGGFKRGKPFPMAVQQTLLSLYKKGMTGWGKQKEPFLYVAMERTKLDLSQIKVVSYYVDNFAC